MEKLFRQLCLDLAVQVMAREVGNVAHQFSGILIDDGSSFAIARGLRDVFPGRFTTKTPAAVELHAHMGLLSGNVLRVALAPDTETERKFLPAPTSLPKGSLSLRDRGYVDIGYFADLSAHGAYLICRSPCGINPRIVKVLHGLPRRIAKRFEGKPLKRGATMLAYAGPGPSRCIRAKGKTRGAETGNPFYGYETAAALKTEASALQEKAAQSAQKLAPDDLVSHQCEGLHPGGCNRVPISLALAN